MNTTEKTLDELIAGWLDESLSESEAEVLSHRLKSDSTCLERFVRTTHLHQGLFEAMVEVPAWEMLEAELTVARTVPVKSIGSCEPCNLERSLETVFHQQTRPNASVSRLSTHAEVRRYSLWPVATAALLLLGFALLLQNGTQTPHRERFTQARADEVKDANESNSSKSSITQPAEVPIVDVSKRELYLIEGQINGGRGGIASITLNGEPAIIEGDRWSKEVIVTAGQNLFAVKVVDLAGNETLQRVMIER